MIVLRIILAAAMAFYVVYFIHLIRPAWENPEGFRRGERYMPGGHGVAVLFAFGALISFVSLVGLVHG